MAAAGFDLGMRFGRSLKEDFSRSPPDGRSLRYSCPPFIVQFRVRFGPASLDDSADPIGTWGNMAVTLPTINHRKCSVVAPSCRTDLEYEVLVG